MKKLIILSAFLFSFLYVQSQEYENSVGLRIGPSNGITLKHFFSTNDAVEGILSIRYRGFNITGLYERHQPIFDTDGMYFLYGVGGHIGFYDNHPWSDSPNSLTVIGIDGILGLEYVFKEIPFNVSLDWKPGLNFVGYSGFWSDEVALSIRYIF